MNRKSPLPTLLLCALLFGCANRSTVAQSAQPTQAAQLGLVESQAIAQQTAGAAIAQATQAAAQLQQAQSAIAQATANAQATAEAYTARVRATDDALRAVQTAAAITQQAQAVSMTQAAVWAQATQQTERAAIALEAQRQQVAREAEQAARWDAIENNAWLFVLGVVCLSVLTFSAVLAYFLRDALETGIKLIIQWREMRARERLVDLAERRVITLKGGEQAWIGDDGQPKLLTTITAQPSAVTDTRSDWLRACKAVAMYVETLGISWSHDDLGEVPGGMYILSRRDWDNVTNNLRDWGVLVKAQSRTTRYADGWDYARVKSELSQVIQPTNKPVPEVKVPQLYAGEVTQ